MLKKTVIAVSAALVMCGSAMAVELPKGAVSGFNTASTAYDSVQFNRILGNYGYSLAPSAVEGLPPKYATVAGDSVVFNETHMAYTPAQYHKILNAYGLDLTAEDAEMKLGGFPSYVQAAGGELVFGEKSTLYGGGSWEKILSAYNGKGMAAPVAMGNGDADGDGVMDGADQCPNTPKGVKVDERGCWAMMNSMLFDFDSAALGDDVITVLSPAKKVFADNPSLKVTIEGHADSSGAAAYNQVLSEKRAQAVKDYLVDMGVAEERLETKGYGETRPAFTNDTAYGRSKNRRVEFTPIK